MYRVRKSVREKHKKIVMLLFFILSSYSIVGQKLDNKSKNSSTDLQILADSLYKQNEVDIKKGKYKEANNKAQKALELYTRLNNDKAIGFCFNRIAFSYYYQGDISAAMSSFEKSLESYKKADYYKGIASSYNNMGAVNYSLGNFPKALNNYKKAAKLQEELDDKRQAVTTIMNIGGIYLELKDYANAMSIFQRAKNINEKISNKNALPQILTGIGFVHMKKKEYSQALSTFEQALFYAEKYNNKKNKNEILFNLGKLFRLQDKNEKALDYFRKSLILAEKTKSLLDKSKTLIEIGKIYEKEKKYKTAIKYSKKGLKIAKKIMAVSIQKEASECLSSSYKAIYKPEKALYFFEMTYLLKDSLNLKKTSDEVIKMEFREQMLLDSITNVQKAHQIEINHRIEVQKKEKQRNIFIFAGIFALLIAGFIFSRLNYVKKSKKILQIEKDRSEHLLLNILPEEIAEELKEKGSVDAQDYDTVSILFTDFKSFTETASKLSPQKLVEELNICFKAFDNIMGKYNIEKIKTIGDAYMAAGGLVGKDVDFVKKTLLAGLDMQAFIHKRKIENTKIGIPAFSMRVGIHVGPIVAGIVGVKKFQYDVWGDTVNIASRMESNGSVEKVNISRDTYTIIKDDPDFVFEYRGKIKAKGKGEMEMYFVSRAETS